MDAGRQAAESTRVTRVVVDTNVFVGGSYSPGSASRRIVDACREGRLRLVVSREVLREYERMLPRAVRRPGELERAMEVIRAAEMVETGLKPEVVLGDPEDDKFFALAWAAGAGVIITNDRLVLEIDGLEGIRVLRPNEFLGAYGE